MDQDTIDTKRELFSRMNLQTPKGRRAYIPDQQQEEIHYSDWKRFVACLGRRRGKSYASAAEICYVLGEEDTRTWIVAPTYDLTDKVFSIVYEQVVTQELYGGDNSILRASKTKDNRYIETAWGSWVKGKSADAEKSLKGEQLDFIDYDECAVDPERIWSEYLEPCLLDRDGRALFTSTPHGYNWFRNYFYRGQEPDFQEDGWKSLHSPSWENPFLSEALIQRIRRSTPEIIFRQEYGAEFEHFSGLVYPDYRDVSVRGHLFDPEENPDWRFGSHYRALDPGYRDPTACIWYSITPPNAAAPSGAIWVYDEYEEAGLVHEAHAENIAAKTCFNIVSTFGPPDLNRTNKVRKLGAGEETAMDMYRSRGIHIRIVSRDSDVGRSTVARAMRATLQDRSVGLRLYISKRCVKLRQSLLEYVWEEPRSLRDVDPPQRPKKRNDHLPDALRYGLVSGPTYTEDLDLVNRPIDTVDRYGYSGTRYEALARKKRSRIPGRAFVLR